MNGEPEEENLNKSEISQVFEIALKRNLPVNFEVSVRLLLMHCVMSAVCERDCSLTLFIIVCKSWENK